MLFERATQMVKQERAIQTRVDFNALTKVITSSLVECMKHKKSQNLYMASIHKNQTCNKRTRTYIHCRWKEAIALDNIAEKKTNSMLRCCCCCSFCTFIANIHIFVLDRCCLLLCFLWLSGTHQMLQCIAVRKVFHFNSQNVFFILFIKSILNQF